MFISCIRKILSGIFVILISVATVANADVKMPGIIGEHMVLQQKCRAFLRLH